MYYWITCVNPTSTTQKTPKQVIGNSHLGAEGGHGGLDEEFGVGNIDRVFLAHLVQFLDGHLGRHLEAVGNPRGMDPPVEQLFGMLEETPGQNWNRSKWL